VTAERWAHLPGGGRGPDQPHVLALRKVRARLTRLVKPVVIFTVVIVAGKMTLGLLPGLVKGAGDGLTKPRPAAVSPSRQFSSTAPQHWQPPTVAVHR